MATIVFRIALHCRSGAPQECNTFAGGIIRRSIIFRGKLTVSRKSHLSLAKVATDQNGVTLKSRHGDEISPAALLRGRRPSPLPSPSACRTVGANRYSPAKIERSMALNVCLLGECRLSTHNAVLHRSRLLSGEAMETLICEGTRLITGYLKG